LYLYLSQACNKPVHSLLDGLPVCLPIYLATMYSRRLGTPNAKAQDQAGHVLRGVALEGGLKGGVRYPSVLSKSSLLWFWAGFCTLPTLAFIYHGKSVRVRTSEADPRYSPWFPLTFTMLTSRHEMPCKGRTSFIQFINSFLCRASDTTEILKVNLVLNSRHEMACKGRNSLK
jgi:hypothetical protein